MEMIPPRLLGKRHQWTRHLWAERGMRTTEDALHARSEMLPDQPVDVHQRADFIAHRAVRDHIGINRCGTIENGSGAFAISSSNITSCPASLRIDDKERIPSRSHWCVAFTTKRTLISGDPVARGNSFRTEAFEKRKTVPEGESLS